MAYLAEWAVALHADLAPESIYVFGSLVYLNGYQFGDKSDVDLVVLMPEIPDALDRVDWLERLLRHKITLEDELGKRLKRADRKAVLSSIIVPTTAEVAADLHKDGATAFFSKNRFVDLRTGENVDGIPGSGRQKLGERLVGECLRFVQKYRNIYLGVNSLSDGGLGAFDDEKDAAPKPIMRHAAMIEYLENEGDAEPGAEFDLDIGADRLTAILRGRRKRIGALAAKFSARRGGRAERGQLTARDQLILAELVYDAAIEAEARATAAAAAPARPSTGGAHSTVLFAERFESAFPGVRGIRWFDDQSEIRQRMASLLKRPLEFEEGTPFWWSRGSSNLQITKYVEAADCLLINGDEMKVSRVAAVNVASYKYEFVYVEVDPLPPIGIYDKTPHRIDEAYSGDDMFPYYWEEYGIVDGKHLVTRAEVDDGSAMINGKLESLHGRLEVRGRYVTRYNFVIAGGGAPLLVSAYDQGLNNHLDSMLKGEDRLELIAEDIKRLPTGRF